MSAVLRMCRVGRSELGAADVGGTTEDRDAVVVTDRDAGVLALDAGTALVVGGADVRAGAWLVTVAGARLVLGATGATATVW